MDREQALKRLKEIANLHLYYELELDEEVFEAVSVAITALEQEPDAIHNEREQAYMKGYEDAIKRFRTEPCEDAISRQAVKEQMIKYGFNAPDMTVTEFVEGLPSVSTEKTGRWGKEGECPFCGYFRKWEDDKFCGNCGAKLGVEE